MVNPDWHVTVRHPLSKNSLGVLSWWHASQRKDRADRLAGKTTTTGGLRLGNSEVLRSLRHYLRKDITPSIVWRREVWKEKALNDLPWEDKKGPSSINRACMWHLYSLTKFLMCVCMIVGGTEDVILFFLHNWMSFYFYFVAWWLICILTFLSQFIF